MTPAEHLTAARLAAGISQYALARRIAEATGGSHHAARNALARWETGRRVPEAESLAVWAKALGVEVPVDDRSRLLTIDSAARALLDAVGPTMPADIPPRLVDALVALQASMVGRE